MPTVAHVAFPPPDSEYVVAIPVVLAAREALQRAALRALLESASEVAVVAEAASTERAFDLARASAARVVVWASDEPLAAERAVRLRASSEPAMVLVTSRFDRAFISAAFRRDVAGLVTTDLGGDALGIAVRRAASGARYVSPSLSPELLVDCLARAAAPRPPSVVDTLSAREREVMRLVAEGRGNRDIADALGISVHTVDSHRRNVMSKLKLSSVVELIRLALREGVIELDPP